MLLTGCSLLPLECWGVSSYTTPSITLACVSLWTRFVQIRSVTVTHELHLPHGHDEQAEKAKKKAEEEAAQRKNKGAFFGFGKK